MRFKVSNEYRHYPGELWRRLEGHSKVRKNLHSDGCSCSPDYWRRFAIWPACVVHDDQYRSGKLGKNWAGRRESDNVLRRNIIQCMRDQNAYMMEAHLVAIVYWGRVRIWGVSAYTWSENEEPLGWWNRLREAYGFFSDQRSRYKRA